jgi:hypothetical protein
MMDEDWNMSRITPDFAWRQDNVAWPPSGFSLVALFLRPIHSNRRESLRLNLLLAMPIVAVVVIIVVATVVAVTAAVSSADSKIRATSAVDPNAVSRDAPGPPVDTRRLATLADEFDATGAVDRAEMSREIVRGAV